MYYAKNHAVTNESDNMMAPPNNENSNTETPPEKQNSDNESENEKTEMLTNANGIFSMVEVPQLIILKVMEQL